MGAAPETAPLYDRWGRMLYHPAYHARQRTPWTTADEAYLLKHYYSDGPEQTSLALERTIQTVMQRAFTLRRAGRLVKPAGPSYFKRAWRAQGAQP